MLTVAFLSGSSLAAANYQISPQTVSSATTISGSASYRLLGFARAYHPKQTTSTSFTIGEGFLRSIYFPPIILAPIVTEISPNSAINTGPVKVTITGANFPIGAKVKLSKSGQSDIFAAEVMIENTGRISCVFDITGAIGGLWDVTVISPDGRSGTLPSAFKITYPAPTIVSVTPDKVSNTETSVKIKITGTNFRPGAAIKLSKIGETDIMADKVEIVSSAEASSWFNLQNKLPGIWDVILTNEDGQSAILTLGLKIEAPEVAIIKPVEIQVTSNPKYPSIKSTSVKYYLSKETTIIIDIFNMRGEKIWSQTYSGNIGENQATWDGITAFKTVAGTGVYFIYITSVSDGQRKILSKQKIGIVR